MPYLQALTWYHAHAGRHQLRQRGPLYVHIISDSQTTVHEGTMAVNLHKPLPKDKRALWAAIREYARLGYRIRYYFAKRGSTLLNKAADLMASLARRAVIAAAEEPIQHIGHAAGDAIDNLRLVDPTTGEPIDITQLHPNASDDARGGAAF